MSGELIEANALAHLNPLEVIQTVAEVQSVVSALQKDGTLDKVLAAYHSVEKEFHDPKVAHLFDRLKKLVHV